MLPEGFSARMQALLQEEYGDFLASYDRPRNVGLRMNPLKSAPAPVSFGLTPVPWCETGFYYDPETRPGLSALHEAGLYYLQEPSAMAPAVLLDARPDETVLDLCAAPGGKSTQIAGMMRGKGLLVCNEISPKRAQILSQNVERLGIANALVLNEHPKNLASRFAAFFDKILVDAPCSGEGMFRKEEAAITDWSEQTVAMCAARQLEILRSAAEMLKPGGRLVYSTCTFSPQENEGVISAFLRCAPDFAVERLNCPWFSPGRPDWIDDPAPGIENTFRLWPHKLRGEGHFAAVLTKSGAPDDAFFKTEPSQKPPKELTEFCREAGITLPEGILIAFAERLFLAPENLPELKGLKVLRAGLELGVLLKNRFEPAHALSHWLQDAENTADFAPDDPLVRRYMAGEAIGGVQSGWALVRIGGVPLGWAKGSGGQLKNHYPKGLRRV